jgi:hypothetical protein
MRFLRSYQSVAHREHFCDCCCRYILMGEQYEGSVYAHNKFGIIVTKQHVNPACDWPDPEEISMAEHKGIEKVLENDFSLSIAA